eukprot:TRINITY_DN21537_c0_g1_i1.p1 TRINITY_DN21537_c0_g1~~TRINITY_DN21537_c0_g1_i1.p1  ORF type:complete len:139 (+),score=2.73 TRINITY_DN21537_c0_g1_i1:60-476(+)
MGSTEVDTSALKFTKIHDLEKSFYDGKVTVSFRVMKMDRMVWIWLGTAPCLTNLSFHVSNKSIDTMPSAIRVIEIEGNEYGVGLGNRLCRKMEGAIVHVASHLPAEVTSDSILTGMVETELVKWLKNLGYMGPKPNTP